MLTPVKPHFLATKSPTPVEETPTGAKLASSLGLMIIADNHFICPSSKDLWNVGGDGGVMRLSSDEVDHDESLQAADANSPESFLASLLQDLDF